MQDTIVQNGSFREIIFGIGGTNGKKRISD
jgi:hypothetical protein